MPSGAKPKPLAGRIMSGVVISPSGCWEWQRSRNELGYGRIWVGSRIDGTRRIASAHRVSYECFVGPIADGLVIDHLCRNPSCVNPNHLEPVSPRENMVRGISPASAQVRLTHCKRGHEFTVANTYRNRGKRYCRTCRRTANRMYREAM